MRLPSPERPAHTAAATLALATSVVLFSLAALPSPARAQPRAERSPMAAAAAQPSQTDPCERVYANPDRKPKRCRDKPGGRRKDATSSGEAGGQGAGPAPSATSTSDPAAAAAGGVQPAIGGQPDPLQSLGVVSPLCAAINDRNPSNDPRLTAAQRLRCQRSGSVESDYPASNYAFDVNIDSSITKPKNLASSTLQTLLEGAWLVWVYFLRGVFALLQWAFGLSPFTDSATMASLDRKLDAMRRSLTDPLMVAILGLIGLGVAWRGIARRQATAALSDALAASAMIVLALVIIAAPKATVGRLAAISNDLAKAAIAAPQGKPPSRSDQTFAGVLAGAWSDLIEEPWCALQFGDVGWCLSSPDAQAVKAAEAAAANDLGALGITRATGQKILGSIADPGDLGQVQDAVNAAVRERYGAPRTRAELYWRYSAESAPRVALYYVYSGKERKDAPLPGAVKSALQVASPIGAANDTATTIAEALGLAKGERGAGLAPEKVAIQDEGGTWTRMGLVPICLIALTGAALLFGWLAVRLFMQAAVAFVLVLATPFVLLFAGLGQAGRRAFVVWLQSLLGAILAKAFYAALLGVTLAGSSLLGQLADRKAWGLSFMLMGLFYWAVFLKRQAFASFLAPPLAADKSEAGGAGRMLAGGYYAMQFGRQAYGLLRGGTRAITSRAQGVGERRQENRAAGEQAVGDVARERTLQRMRDWRDEQTDQAETRQRGRAATRSELEQVNQDLSDLRGRPDDQTPDRHERAQALSERRARLRARLAETDPQAQADRALLAAHAANGGGWTDRQLLAQAGQAKRRLSLPADAAENLRHYRQLSPQDYRALAPEQRQRVLSEIEVSRQRDRQRFNPHGELAAIPDLAPHAPGGARAAAQTMRQHAERRDPDLARHIAQRQRDVRGQRYQHARRARRPTRGR
jgi:hypothetical protein